MFINKQQIIHFLKILYFPSDNKNRYKRWFINLLKIATHIFFLILLLIFLVYIGTFGHIPSTDELRKINNDNASEIYSSNGKLIGRIFHENRISVDSCDISKHVINALIATEDSRFFEHNGVDVTSLGRVLFRTFLMFDFHQGGGSTISQQLAKNLYPRQRWGFLTYPIAKIKEIIIAQRIEKVYSKDEILTLYLNTVPFGENIYGIETASQRFFGKKAKKLTINEAATLVGLLAANTAYNPRINPEHSLSRRNIVLERMANAGYIDTTELIKYKNEPIKLNYNRIDNETGIALHFRQMIANETQNILDELYGKNKYNIYTDGLQITTTINSWLQQYAESAVTKHISTIQTTFDKQWEGKNPWENNKNIFTKAYTQSERYKILSNAGVADSIIERHMNTPTQMTIYTANGSEKVIMSPIDSIRKSITTLNAGLVAFDPNNGDVLAWVGGVNYQLSQIDHVTTHRQVGSTFKPIVYASALETGIEPDIYIENIQRTYSQNWSPANSGGEYGGFYSLKGALSKSLNTISAWIINEIGPDNVVEMAKKLDIESNIPAVPSIALGTAELSLFEMTKAYEAFTNGGYIHEQTSIISIKDNQGNILYKASRDISGKQAMSEQTAIYVNDMMRAVVDSGTARSLRSTYTLNCDLIGKTGTTQNSADGWFIGATPNIVVGAWVGCDIPAIRFKSSAYGQGAYMALPIVGRFLSSVSKSNLSKFTEGKFPEPLTDEMRIIMSYPYYCEYEPNKDLLRNEALDNVLGLDTVIQSNNRRPIKSLFKFMKDLFRKE